MLISGVIALSVVLASAVLAAWPKSDPSGGGSDPGGDGSVLEASQPVSDHSLRHIVTSWDASRGLPLNSVTSVIETQDGYLWVGMLGGLARFDGMKFTLFNSGKTQGMSGNRINSLFQDHSGTLWIGTDEGGLTKLEHGQFESYIQKDGLPANDVASPCEGPDGSIWALSANQLVSYKEGVFVTHLDAIPSGVIGRRLFADERGAVWIGTDSGLVKWDKSGRFIYTAKDGLPANEVRDIVPSQGGILIATKNGIARLKNGNITTESITNALPVTHLIETRSGDLWFSIDSGPLRWLHDGRLTEYSKAAGISGAAGKALCEDRQGNIWYGTIDGLNRFRTALFSVFGFDTPGATVAGITQDASGNIWLAQTCLGLIRVDAKTLTSTVFDARQGLPHECVWSVFSDPDGTIWAGTWGGGLVRLRDGAVETYTAGNSGLSNNTVLSIFRDSAGSLWVGTGNGLNLQRGNRFVTFGERDGLVGHDVRVITEDSTGGLWIGTTSGLSRLKDRKFTNYTMDNGLSNNFVRDLYEDRDGAIWIATYGGGLERFKNGSFAKCNSDAGLSDDFISRILEDDQGNFWISSNRGIIRASKAELDSFADGKARSFTSTLYGVSEGMKTAECNGGAEPAGWKAADGALWFPTVKGAVRLAPQEAISTDAAPKAAIEEVQVDHKSFDPNAAIIIPPGKGDLDVRFTGLDLGSPERVRFRYRLDGYDDTWINAGTERVAHFTKIPPGSYTFRVATVGDWPPAEAEALFRFKLQAHFYQTIWFYGLAGLAMVFALIGVFRLRVSALKRRASELEATVGERTAEIEAQKNSVARAYRELERTNRQMVRSNDDMLSVLNKLRLGVLLVDGSGALVFVSETAERLIGESHGTSEGKYWHEVLALKDQERNALKAMIESGQPERNKLPVELATKTGRYWTEIEVRDDPRGDGKKIIFLYDVSEVYDLRSQLGQKAEFKGLVGQSIAMQLVFKQIRDVSKFDTTVLIEGETGTGKELVARAIHLSSSRKDKPYIPVNCGGLTESVLSSQLFGHKRGAFTGAVADHIGLFEAANGGTIFLDEIGDIPLSVQTSLLRVLQEREITRLGESRPRKIDARVISATHRDLAKGVEAGTFREDLLYRIRVARIQLPPLRKRPEDIPLLASSFLNQHRASSGKPIQDVSSEAMAILLAHKWPGNVRELKSAMEHAVIHSQGPLIRSGDLPQEIIEQPDAEAERTPIRVVARPETEQERLLQALKDANGNRSAAARLLGMSRATFYRKIAGLGIEHKNSGSQDT